jgi:hypothetical protein
MADDWSQLAGEIASVLDLDQMAASLVRQGIRVQVRASCQYEGGRYIRVYEGAVDFSLERTREEEFLARADATSVDQMDNAAARVSRALAALDVRHAFEVYDGEGQLVRYLHHRWPTQGAGLVG